MSFDDVPIDPTSAERLAHAGLELRLVDDGAFAGWLQADFRGFHDGRVTDERLAEIREHTRSRRTTGVYDPQAPHPETPVATSQSWAAPLTVPGGGTLDLWAIASVTVAPTHRRRGVARALLEAELRTAAGLGLPIAGLTVSEATIYGRFGFGPAVFADVTEIETTRVRWAGPDAPGRLHFVEPDRLWPDRLWPDAVRISDALRAQQPGALRYDDYFLGSAVGRFGDDRARIRTVRYDDADGTPQGFVCYEVTPGEGDFTKHTATVRYLLGATDEAVAALWRHLLELDLVATVRASGRPVDEPVNWQLGDLRAARRRRVDTLWLRVLDLPAVFEARRYAAAVRIVLDVSDPLGFTSGRYLLEVAADATGRVRRIEGEAPAGAASLALGIDALSSLYLGGVAATVLARAGRIAERTPGAALLLERALAPERAPWLTLGF